MAFSLLVVFLYGGLVWGISPQFFPGKSISWESHLLGGLAGIILAFAYRGEGPQRQIYHWDEDEEEMEYFEEEPVAAPDLNEGTTAGDKEPENPPTENNPLKINYIYKDDKPYQ